MRRKRKVGPLPVANKELIRIVNATIGFHVKQDPISPDEKKALWHWTIAPELLAAIELIGQSGYGVYNAHSNTAVFAVPEWGLGIRWAGGPFLRAPKTGPHKIDHPKFGNVNIREMSEAVIADVLGRPQADRLLEWAKVAIDVSDQCIEAKTTLNKLFTLTKTPGQLKRMVPSLAQYLPEATQALLADQERSSPYPDGWAEFNKSAVDRMLVVVARGHLVKDTASTQFIAGEEFTWAQKLP